MNWVMTVAIFCLLIRLTFNQDSAVKPIISVMPSVCQYICLVIYSSLLLHWLCVSSLEYSWLRKITFMAKEEKRAQIFKKRISRSLAIKTKDSHLVLQS